MHTIQEQLLQLLSERVQKNIHELSSEQSLMELFNGNAYALSHFLLDVHEHFDLPSIEYASNDEHKLFTTVQDFMDYFIKRIPSPCHL